MKVKKVQRSFAVEYKSGRRKPDPKPHSIWGHIDLKSVAQDVEDEVGPFLPTEPQVNKTYTDDVLSEAKRTASLLTQPVGQPTTASALQETKMAEENNTTMDADVPATVVPDLPEKVRKPRAKKTAPETASADVAAEPAASADVAVVKQKRGRKSKSDAGAEVVKRAPVKRAPKSVPAAAATPVAVTAIDEMADLLQLEEENQKLRKLLSEKLRAENADLRKRLNLG